MPVGVHVAESNCIALNTIAILSVRVWYDPTILSEIVKRLLGIFLVVCYGRIMAKRTNTGVSLLPSILTALDEIASTDEQGRSRNQLIEEACRQFVKRQGRRRSLGEFGGGKGGQESPTHPVTGDTTFSGHES